MASRQIQRSTVVDATPEDIWPWLVDAERELAWRTPEVIELERLDGGPLGTGSEFRGAIRVAGKRDAWVNELTIVDEPKQLAWRTVETTAPVASPGSYHLEPTAHGTRVTIELDQEAQNLLGRLALPVMGLVVPRVVDRFLRQLKELVEAA